MSGIIELSTGHVFAAGSVKALTPLVASRSGACSFHVKGVGFEVVISWHVGEHGMAYQRRIGTGAESAAWMDAFYAEVDANQRAKAMVFYNEARDKLLGSA